MPAFALAALAAAFTVASPPVVASAASRVPADPTVLFREGFENVPPHPNMMLTNYVGANGETYTADPAWVSRTACNGFIVDSSSSALPGDCDANHNGAQAFANLRLLSRLLGTIGGTDPDTNAAVAAYTEANPGANKIEFRTDQQIPMAAPNRFLTFSVDSVAGGCGSVPAPALRFYLEDSQGNVTPVSNHPIDPCTGTYTLGLGQGGHFAADGSFMLSGSSLGIVLRNENGSGRGNDGAFDNIEVLDVTPIVDKSFSPATVGTNQPSTLTFTVTNTSEKASKDGFSFTDNLPAGLVVAPTPNFTSTCDPATITAGGAAGDTSVAFRGSLATGQTSCTFKIDVTAANEGSYTNTTADNLTNVVGLNRGENATLKVEDPRLTAVKRLNGTRIVDTDQFMVRIRQGTTVVNDPTNASTAGTGASITTGTGTTGTTQVTAGSTYTVDEVPTGTAVLDRYGTTVTCQDAAGIQSGLPNGVSATRVSITPDAGAKITCTFTNTPLTSSITLDKRVSSITDKDGNGLNDVGDIINFEFTVTNTGGTTLTNVTVNDPSLGAVTCPDTTLAPGASTTCTAVTNHTIVQADVDAGHYANTATATGTEPGGDLVVSPPDSTDTPIPGTVNLAFHKRIVKVDDVNGDHLTDLGDTIKWEFDVTNVGNMTLHDVTDHDDRLTAAGIAVTCPAGNLAPQATITCTAPAYTITQADMDDPSGQVVNIAAASALDPANNAVNSPTDSTATPLQQGPLLGLEKKSKVNDANHNGRTDIGDTISYTFVVTNTGNVTLHAPAIRDDKLAALGISITCPTGNFGPNQHVTCTATTPYSITQADLDAGNVHNVATATASDPGGQPVMSPQSERNTPLSPISQLKLVKKVSRTAISAVGDLVNYTFEVTNTGDVTLTNLTLKDDIGFSGTGPLVVTCPATTLAPHTSMTCTAPYVVTQADLDAGKLTNKATETGTPPNGPNVTTDDEAPPALVTPTGKLALTKTADLDLVTAADQTITYQFLVANNGNVTVKKVSIQEVDFNGTGKLSPITCPATELAPGTQMTCQATYQTTADDLKKPKIVNTAIVVGTLPNGKKTTTPQSTATVPVQVPGDLAFTGAQIEGAATIGASLLVAGTVLLLVIRRRQTAP